MAAAFWQQRVQKPAYRPAGPIYTRAPVRKTRFIHHGNLLACLIPAALGRFGNVEKQVGPPPRWRCWWWRAGHDHAMAGGHGRPFPVAVSTSPEGLRLAAHFALVSGAPAGLSPRRLRQILCMGNPRTRIAADPGKDRRRIGGETSPFVALLWRAGVGTGALARRNHSAARALPRGVAGGRRGAGRGAGGTERISALCGSGGPGAAAVCGGRVSLSGAVEAREVAPRPSPSRSGLSPWCCYAPSIWLRALLPARNRISCPGVAPTAAHSTASKSCARWSAKPARSW